MAKKDRKAKRLGKKVFIRVGEISYLRLQAQEQAKA